MTQMCKYFKTKTDVAQNLIDGEKKIGGTGLISEETEALHVELNERVKATRKIFSSI